MNKHLENIKQFEKELLDAKNLNEDLKAKLLTMKQNRELLESNFNDAKRKLKTGKVEFYKNSISDIELDSLQKNFDDTSAAFLTYDDDLSALEQALHETSAAFAKIDQKLHAAKIKFWNGVSGDIASTIGKDAKETIERLWASRLLGAGGSYENILATLFPRPDMTRLGEIKEQLKGQYGID